MWWVSFCKNSIISKKKTLLICWGVTVSACSGLLHSRTPSGWKLEFGLATKLNLWGLWGAFEIHMGCHGMTWVWHKYQNLAQNPRVLHSFWFERLFDFGGLTIKSQIAVPTDLSFCRFGEHHTSWMPSRSFKNSLKLDWNSKRKRKHRDYEQTSQRKSTTKWCFSNMFALQNPSMPEQLPFYFFYPGETLLHIHILHPLGHINFHFAVAVALPFQPGHLSLLRVSQAFGGLHEFAILPQTAMPRRDAAPRENIVMRNLHEVHWKGLQCLPSLQFETQRIWP